MLNVFNHVSELKIRLFYFLISLIFSLTVTIYNILEISYILVGPMKSYFCYKDVNFIFINLFEVINSYITIIFYSFIFFNTPIVFYFIYSFIKSGLFIYEKKYMHIFFSLFNINFIFSNLFTYYIVLPSILNFLLSLNLATDNIYIDIDIQMKFFDYVNIICYFMYIYSFLIFQIPTIVLMYIYVFRPESKIFYTKRRFFILLFLLVGCIFSTPDVYCLLLISLPLLFFFEISTFLCLIQNKYKKI